MHRQLFPALLVASLLTGCCNCLKPLPPRSTTLPPPITLQQQLDELNARAVQIPRFKAVADQSGIEAILPDKNGKPKRQPASEGTLLLQQNYATHGASLLLSVRYFDKEIFQLGENDQQWWAIERADHPQAYTGPLQAGPDLGSRSPATMFELLADAIPELLAITEIVPDPNHIVTMRIDDDRGVNDLLILRPQPDGTATLDREILVDRRSGEVREVDLYRQDGMLLVRATLNNYESVTIPGTPASGAASAPLMPRNIIIDYPAQQSRLGLRLASVSIPANFANDPFALPDWNDEGITPQVVK